MKSKRSSLMALLLVVAMLVTSFPAAAFGEENQTQESAYAEGEALVYVDPTQMPQQRSRTSGILESYNPELLMRLPQETEQAEEEEENLFQTFAAPVDSSPQLMLVKSTEQSTQEIIASLEQDPRVVYAEPNCYLELYSNDPLAAGQWAIKNESSFTGGTHTQAEINTEKAWNAMKAPAAGSEPVVAVVDTGVDYNHADLKDIMWKDENENSPMRALGGGVYGYSPADNDTTNPMDKVIGHGTHCAGIIAEQIDNVVGGVGIAGNLKTKIMAVKLLNGDAPGKVDTALRAFEYVRVAKENGVNVVAVNNSWGPSKYDDPRPLSLSVATDQLGQAGIISCYAAGNDNINTDLNTGGQVASDYAINVGAIDSAGVRSPFSNYGQRTVDVMAPGSQILSTVPTVEDDFSPEIGSMYGQFLPRYAKNEDKYFYRGYEAGEGDDITYKVIDSTGAEKGAGAVNTNVGYQSAQSMGIPLTGLTEGETFSIEMTVPVNLLTGAKDQVAYLNMMIGNQDFSTGSYVSVHYLDANNVWQRISYTSLDDSRWVNLEGIWGEYPLEDETPLTLRLQFNNPSEGKLVPIGYEKIGDNPMVFLDDFGMGKSRKGMAYAYANGTSMASPVVAGIAALVATQYPEDPIGKNIARIKGGVNRDNNVENGIVDSSVSMGYVDAYKSVTENVVPVLNSLSCENGTATLKGYFFGRSVTVTVGGVAANVISYEEETIVFKLPDSIEGYQEVSVTSDGEKFGHNFFSVTPDTKGYTSLETPDFTYETKSGLKLGSGDFETLDLVGAGNYLLRTAYSYQVDVAVLECYDRTSGEWRQVDLPGNIVSSDIAVCGAATKFYLVYISDAGTNMLATYDPVSDEWQNVVPTAAPFLCGLVVYGDKLLAVGGARITDESTLEYLAENIVIDPATGNKMGDFTALPFKAINVKGEVAGERLLIHGGVTANESGEAVKNQRAILWDGSNWSDVMPDFEPLTRSANVDPQQTMDIAWGAGTDQLLAAGPVSGLDTADMRDTWQTDYSQTGWQANSELLYCQRKTFGNVGQAYGGNFYALANTGRADEKLIFRATPLATTDPVVDPVGPTPTPDPPTPSPQPSVPSPTANNGAGLANTGDETPLTLWLALGAAAIVGFGLVVYLRRKKVN